MSLSLALGLSPGLTAGLGLTSDEHGHAWVTGGPYGCAGAPPHQYPDPQAKMGPVYRQMHATVMQGCPPPKGL